MTDNEASRSRTNLLGSLIFRETFGGANVNVYHRPRVGVIEFGGVVVVDAFVAGNLFAFGCLHAANVHTVVCLLDRGTVAMSLDCLDASMQRIGAERSRVPAAHVVSAGLESMFLEHSIAASRLGAIRRVSTSRDDAIDWADDWSELECRLSMRRSHKANA